MYAFTLALLLSLAPPALASGDDGDPPVPAAPAAPAHTAPAAPAPAAPAPAPGSAEPTAPVAPPEPAPPPVLKVQPTGTTVYALVYKKGAAAAFAHDHVIHAQKVTGTAVVDTADPSRSRVEVIVSATNLFPDADDMRAMVGLPKRLDDGQRETILDHIQAEYQLFVSKYDTISFRSTSVTKAGESWTVSGDFTLRGVTRRISVPMTITPEGDGWRAKGKFRVIQSDYGYEPYYAMAGALQVEDYVDIVVDARLGP